MVLISEFHPFTRNSVAKAKNVIQNQAEPADPKGDGWFVEWMMLSFQAIRIEVGKSYPQTIDLLSEMLGILEELCLTRLPQYTVMRDWFEKVSVKTYRAFLR